MRFTPAAATGGRTGKHLISSHLWACPELLAALPSRFQAAAPVCRRVSQSPQPRGGGASSPLSGPRDGGDRPRSLSGSGPFPLPIRVLLSPALGVGLAHSPTPLPSFRGFSQPVFRSRAGTEWRGARAVTFPTSCAASSALSPDSCQNGQVWPSPGGCRAATGPLENWEPAACWQEPRMLGPARPRAAGSSCCGRETGTQRTCQACSRGRDA